MPQAQAVASLIALSGGTVISGDRLYDLDAAQLAILTKVLPTYGAAARPLDLFVKDRPELFALHIQQDFDSWWLVGYFNWDEEAEVTRELHLSRLGLEAHTLTGDRKGTWSLSVMRNRRQTFGNDTVEREICDVNLEDYH